MDKAIIIIKSISGSKLRFLSTRNYSQVDLKCVYQDKESGISVSIGSDNKLLVFYEDSSIQITKDSISIDASHVNIKGKEINISSESINTTSNIRVCDFNIPSNSKIVDNNEEESFDV